MEDLQQIFIVGPPRSGTSMVAKSLAMHTGGFVVTEVPLVTYFCNWFSGENRVSNFEKKTMGFNKFYGVADINFDKKLSFSKFYMTYLKKWGNESKVIIDKNPFYAFQVRHLLRAFPGAKILFVFRDSLATINSHLENEHKLGVDVGFHAHLWNFFVDEYIKLKEEFSDQVKVVKYDSFVSDSEEELSRIFKAMQWEKLQKKESLDQIIIKGKDDQSRFVDSLLEKIEDEPNESRLTSWKNNLSAAQQAKIASITSKRRYELGYVDQSDGAGISLRGYLKAGIKVFKEKMIYYLPVWMKDLILKTK